MYSVRWRLLYADGRVQDEEPSGSTILHRWAMPAKLQITASGRPFWEIAIPPDAVPVFYRWRGTSVNGSAGIQTDALVFGLGRNGLNTIDALLWCWDGHDVRDCPAEYNAPNTVEHLVLNAPEVARMV